MAPSRLRARLVPGALSIAALCCAPAVATAQPPTLTVENVGQPAIPISGATPTSATASNACAAPLTLMAPCGPGGWPELGLRPWGPELPAAGGDTFALTFSAPVTAVEASATTNFPLGLTTPDGTPVPNEHFLAPAAASATADLARWTVTLPTLDARGSGGTFSVVATDADGPHGYALSLRTPRWIDEAARCGPTYVNPALQLGSCLRDTPVKGAPPLPPVDPPSDPAGPAAQTGQPARGRAGRGRGRGRPQAPRASHPRLDDDGTLRLRLRVAVPAAGTLRLALRAPGRRGWQRLVLHPRARGTVPVRFVLPRSASDDRRRSFTLRLALRSAAGTAERTQRFVVGR